LSCLERALVREAAQRLLAETRVLQWLLGCSKDGARRINLSARDLALRLSDQPCGRRLEPATQFRHERVALESGRDRRQEFDHDAVGRLMKLRRGQNTPEFRTTDTTAQRRRSLTGRRGWRQRAGQLGPPSAARGRDSPAQYTSWPPFTGISAPVT
jgi:hypothetical protein